MNKIFFLSIFLALSSSMFAQQTNPFDIKKRKQESQVISEKDIETTSAPPPGVEPKPLSAIETPTIDSVSTPEVKKLVEPIKKEESFLEMQQQKVLAENPFNVSHIPIFRKGRINPIENKAAPKRVTTESKRSPSEEETDKGEMIQEIADSAIANADSSVGVTQDIPVLDESMVSEVIPDQLRRLPTNKFIFWLLFLQLLLLTSLIGINRDFIRKIWRSVMNDNFAKLIGRDYNNGYNLFFFLLYLIFLLSLSIFIYLVIRSRLDFNGLARFVLVFLGVVGVYSIRHLFQNISSAVFPFGKASRYYDFMIVLFNSFLGLLLIPVNVMMAYGPEGMFGFWMIMGFVFFGILYLMRFLRGSLNAYNYISNYLFHFFLYLCTCEIAPVLILVKLLSKSLIN